MLLVTNENMGLCLYIYQLWPQLLNCQKLDCNASLEHRTSPVFGSWLIFYLFLLFYCFSSLHTLSLSLSFSLSLVLNLQIKYEFFGRCCYTTSRAPRPMSTWATSWRRNPPTRMQLSTTNKLGDSVIRYPKCPAIVMISDALPLSQQKIIILSEHFVIGV